MRFSEGGVGDQAKIFCPTGSDIVYAEGVFSYIATGYRLIDHGTSQIAPGRIGVNIINDHFSRCIVVPIPTNNEATTLIRETANGRIGIIEIRIWVFDLPQRSIAGVLERGANWKHRQVKLGGETKRFGVNGFVGDL